MTILMAAVGAGADEIELTNGARYRGLVLEQTRQSVTFKIVYDRGSATVQLPRSEIKSLKITGKEQVTVDSPAKPTPKPEQPGRPEPAKTPARFPPQVRTRIPSDSEIVGRIERDGDTPPAWWEEVELDYPQTLDLGGTNPAKDWNTKRNLGQYIWSIVNVKPHIWRGTIKLLHHVVTVRENDPPRLRDAMFQLAHAYRRYERDWVRAAYWYRKAMGMRGKLFAGQVVWLAECYFHLGGKRMAMDLLRRYRLDRAAFAPGIKLYAEMGETGKALSLAMTLTRRRADEGFLLAGNTYRLHGEHAKALSAYEKVLKVRKGSERIKQHRQRARDNIEGIRACDAFDLSSASSGTYTASSMGYRGAVHVEVAIKDGRIESVKVTRHKEDIYYTCLTDVPKQIVETQGVKKIDAITGATVTSEAILNAAAKGLSKGMK